MSQVAEHMTLGASPGDTAAAAWLAQAGREAMSASPASAVLQFERALALQPPQPVYDDIAAHLIVANHWCGRAAEAASLAERVLASAASSAVQTRVRLALIHALWLQGRWDRALSVALERCADPTIGEDERGRLLAETAMARVYLDGPEAGSAQASEALALGEASGDDVTVCVALNALSIGAYFNARFSEAVAFGERAAAVADRSSTDEARRRHPYFMLGLAYVGVDRLADAEAEATGPTAGSRSNRAECRRRAT